MYEGNIRKEGYWEMTNPSSLADNYTLKNGLKIPCVGFGTWQTPDGEVAERSVSEAIRAGYRHIDTAAAYGNEESVGKGIAKSGVSREDLFITTKLWNTERGYQETIDAFDVFLKKLGIEYLDLYLIHWPAPAPFRDVWRQKNAESWKAMEDLYLQGKVRAIGISNFLPHHIDELIKTAVIMPMVNQIRLHPACQQRYLVEYSRRYGMLLEAYSPLGTGKMLSNPLIVQIAEQYGKSPAQICLRWNLQKGFLPMPKSVTEQRIRENAEIFDFELNCKDMQDLDTLDGAITYSDHPDMVAF